MSARLREYCAGLLDHAQSGELERHVAECEACAIAVDTLADNSDATIRAISALGDVVDDEPDLRRLHARLLAEEGSGGLRSRRFADPPIGDLPCSFGNYELLACIGRGAWGAVYRARHTKLDAPVAVKVLDPARLPDQQAVDQFLREAKAAGQLRHPNIVRATDAGQAEGLYYLAMELVDGIDAGQLLQAGGEMSVGDACEIVRQAALALDYAHRQGWVHRDVKPSNLIVDASGEVKVLDLGIAGQQQLPPNAADGEEALGTAAYMAPEQWVDFHRVDARADVYSLGCTLWKLLTKRTPDHDAGACLRHIRPDVSRSLDHFVHKTLASQPDLRVASASEVAARLQRPARSANLSGLVVWAARKDGCNEVEPVARAPRRFAPTRRRALVAAGVLGVAAAVAPLLLRSSSPRLRRSLWRTLEPSLPSVWLSLAEIEGISVERAAAGRWQVQSEDLALVSLGRVVSAPFAVRLGLSQRDHVGAAGVFFGGQRKPQSNIAQFQLLELRPPDNLSTPTSRRLLWTAWTVALDPVAAEARRIPLAETPIDCLPDAEPFFLQLTLGQNAFPAVAWNGEALSRERWTLSAEGRRLANLPAINLEQHCLGHIGVAVKGDSTEFHSPQIAYL